MNVLITLSSAGASTGPTFNLYSDVDTYATPFETGVAKSALLAGYTSTVVPNAATMIRVQSVGACTNYGLFSIAGVTTTTTTTSGGGTTTTTTTGSTPTTTTTTTAGGGTTTTTTTNAPIVCYTYSARNDDVNEQTLFWLNCDGSPNQMQVAAGQTSSTFCAQQDSVFGYLFTINQFGVCGPTTTTTTTIPGQTTTTTTTVPGQTTTTTTTTAAPILYTQYTLCTDFNVKYYIVGSGVGSTATIAGQCYQIAGTTYTPVGTEFFASDGPCECP